MNPSWANSRWQWMSGRVSCICSRDVQGAKKAATLFTRKSTELASPCRLQRITLRSGRVHHQMGEAMMGDHALSRRWVGRSGRGYLMWPAGPRVKKAPSTSPQPQPQRPARAREPTFDHHDMCSTSPLHAQPHAEAEASLRPAGRSVVRALPMCDACEWSMAFGFRWRRGAVLGMGGPCRRTAAMHACVAPLEREKRKNGKGGL